MEGSSQRNNVLSASMLEADAHGTENDDAAAENAPSLPQRIFNEIIPLEDLRELGLTIDDIEEMALSRSEQLLDDLIEAYTQGRIDLFRFNTAILALQASVIMQEMVFDPNVEVRTGLTQAEIQARMEPRIYGVFNNVSADDVGCCCICLDDFANNDQLGKLDCGHEFHYDCIQPWLVEKNVCPICKKTALA